MLSQNLSETLGAVLIGSAFAAVLTGVVTTQTIYFYQSYPDDKPSLKLMVFIIWFLDLLHTMMVFATDWIWLIEHFNDSAFIKKIPWSLGVTVVLTATITLMVHSFFAYRIHRLSRANWYVVGPILVISVMRLALASVSCAEMLRYGDFADFVKHVAWVFTMGLVASSALDVIITACLLWYLDHARSGFARMDQIVNTLCLYAIENGLLTSVAIVISLGCWLGMQDNLIFLAFHFIVSKLYANSFLATLNSRKLIRERNRRTCLPDGTQLVTVFNLPRSPGLKHSSEHIGTPQTSEEKSSMRHDEEADIALSSIRPQGKSSMESGSTSRVRTTVVDIR